MASSLAIYYTPMHFMWGVKSGATPVIYHTKLCTNHPFFLNAQKPNFYSIWLSSHCSVINTAINSNTKQDNDSIIMHTKFN